MLVCQPPHDGKMIAVTLWDRDCGSTGGKLRYFLISLNIQRPNMCRATVLWLSPVMVWILVLLVLGTLTTRFPGTCSYLFMLISG